MDDITAIVVETASRLFHDHVTPAILADAETGAWLTELWRAAEAAGLPFAMIPEEAGGFGLAGVAAANLVRLAAHHALPLPLGETMLAASLLARAGLEVPEGPLTIAAAGPGLDLVWHGGHWSLAGTARRVPWGRQVAAVVVVAAGPEGPVVALCGTGGSRVVPGRNLALEPRDDLVFALDLPAERVAPSAIGPDGLEAMGAALRVLAMAGAIDRVLALTVQHVSERVQFGRALGKFQAVQQSMAVLAGQAAAAGGAADMAAECLAGNLDVTRIAAAKIRAGEAAGIAGGIAHQLHGAMGFSFEHPLQFYTKRLWAWRDEFGSEAMWSRRLGAEVLRRGAGALWPFVATA